MRDIWAAMGTADPYAMAEQLAARPRVLAESCLPREVRTMKRCHPWHGIGRVRLVAAKCCHRLSWCCSHGYRAYRW